jgi:Domain of unknown function (DUF6265)
MRGSKPFGAGVCLLLALLGPGLAAAGKPNSAPPPPLALAKLGWLAGSWRLEKGGRVMEEEWMAPAAGVMLGMSRTVAKGRVVEYGFLQIREGPDGELFYVTQRSGQPEATYPISSLTDAAAAFESPDRDYPRKISYTLQPEGALLVVFEGPGPEGETKVAEFSYLRLPP